MNKLLIAVAFSLCAFQLADARSIQDELLILNNQLSEAFASFDPDSVDRFRHITAAINARNEILGKTEPRYIIVNKKDYILRVVDRGREVFTFKAIIGRDEQPTPLIDKSYVTAVVVNPDWIVSPRTAALKLAPRFAEDPNYADAVGYQIYANWSEKPQRLNPRSIDWNYHAKQGIVPFRIRQVPGKLNELGSVKFIIPNTDGIFIHGSPHKSLFDKELREFSSGCIRIREEIELANWLMDDKLSVTEINTLIRNRRTKAFEPPLKTSVHIVDWDPIKE